MDQRRFIAFLVISMGVWLLTMQLFPPPPAAKQQPGAAAPDKGKAESKNAAVAPEAKKTDANKTQSAALPQAPAGAAAVPAIAADKTAAQFVALGSLDPNSGYRMLVTLTNSGAAVLRAEMTSSRYRDQHDWSGYLGDLELKNVAGGVQVQVVGAGTPAAAAKIEAGDIIVSIANPETIAIKSADDLTNALASKKPDQQITVQVRHAGNAPEPRTVQLMRRPFAVVRPEIENYQMREVKPLAEFVDRPSFLLTLYELNGKQLAKDEATHIAQALESGNWELTAHDESSAEFRRVMPELKFELIKRYKLAAAPPDARADPNFAAYHLNLEIELKNTDKTPQTAAYRLDGPTGMPLEGWWYARKISQSWSGAGLRDVAMRFVNSSSVQVNTSQIVKGKFPPAGDGQTLAYAGVDGQYFSAVLIPQLASLTDVWFDTTEAVIVDAPADVKNALFANATCRLSRKTIQLDPGGSQRDSYQIFLGPKRPDLLAEYYPHSAQWEGDPAYSLRDLIYYGWFGTIARGMLGILHFFYSIVGNYGIAIILLTVLVRGAMFPISYKQTKNMARMQALKPEMDHISEKYKTDMQKKSQAIQELYRKNKINPLGGCLPLFLQMPIFIGLYRALAVDVELRQAPLFGLAIQWCSNLAAPDMFLDWSNFMPAFVTQGMLGPYLNIFPIITVAIMMVTQKMSMPPPTNEQAAMQQKMMKYMMIFFGLMFYKVASGLCLYLIVSSLWGITERKLLPKAQPNGAGNPASAIASPSATNGSVRSKKQRKANRKK